MSKTKTDEVMNTAMETEETVQAPEAEAKKELTDAEMDSAAKLTGNALSEEAKVKIKIPKDPLNKDNTAVPVGINGYFYNIKRGETVEVPESVASLLERGGYI